MGMRRLKNLVRQTEPSATTACAARLTAASASTATRMANTSLSNVPTAMNQLRQAKCTRGQLACMSTRAAVPSRRPPSAHGALTARALEAPPLRTRLGLGLGLGTAMGALSWNIHPNSGNSSKRGSATARCSSSGPASPRRHASASAFGRADSAREWCPANSMSGRAIGWMLACLVSLAESVSEVVSQVRSKVRDSACGRELCVYHGRAKARHRLPACSAYALVG